MTEGRKNPAWSRCQMSIVPMWCAEVFIVISTEPVAAQIWAWSPFAVDRYLLICNAGNKGIGYASDVNGTILCSGSSKYNVAGCNVMARCEVCLKSHSKEIRRERMTWRHHNLIATGREISKAPLPMSPRRTTWEMYDILQSAIVSDAYAKRLKPRLPFTWNSHLYSRHAHSVNRIMANMKAVVDVFLASGNRDRMTRVKSIWIIVEN